MANKLRFEVLPTVDNPLIIYYTGSWWTMNIKTFLTVKHVQIWSMTTNFRNLVYVYLEIIDEHFSVRIKQNNYSPTI